MNEENHPAISHSPQPQTAVLLQTAIEHYQAGRLAEAEAIYRQILVAEPNHADALHLLGLIAHRVGQHPAAIELIQQAIRINHAVAVYHVNLAIILGEKGDLAASILSYQQAVKLVPNNVLTLNYLGRALLAAKRLNEAEAAFRRALTIDPANLAMLANLRHVLCEIVPPWHFEMMNDNPRNEAYEQAIKSAIQTGDHVLDIGTGAGLLAMMAARAGASHVTTCEMVAIVAAKAAQIVANNGLSERIKVIAKKSNDLQVGLDMPRQADVLVSEILASNLLAEMVLPTLEDAKARLIRPGARIIPASGAIHGFLVGSEQLEQKYFVGNSAGFDLKEFNEFTPFRVPVNPVACPLQKHSEDFEVFYFDFTGAGVCPPERKTLEVPVTRSGRVVGVLQWIFLRLDRQITFENHPGKPNPIAGWLPYLYTFPAPLDVHDGQVVRLCAQHNRIGFLIYLMGIS